MDLPPQTLTEAPTSTAEQEAALATPERPAASEADPSAAEPSSATPSKPQPPAADSELSGRKQTVVIRSSGASGVTPQTLQQATASERERRAAAEAPVAVITNQNLPDLAAGGQVTVIGAGDGASAGATPAAAPGASGGVVTATGATTTAPPAAASGGAPPAASTANAAGASAPSAALAEEYWRGQALKIRLDWKAAVEAVDQLQSDVADLRRRFYEEDDPFYRDNEIKPAWDRALDRLQEAKADAEAQERKLTRFLEEGRKSGALPGWLREGLEFEPPPTADRSPAERRRSDDPWEPKVLEDEPRDP